MSVYSKNVNVIHGTSLAGGSGATDSSTLRVVLATDSPAGNTTVTSLPVSFDSGASDATTQRVILATDNPAVDTTVTSLPVSFDSGASDATTQRVILATDNPTGTTFLSSFASTVNSSTTPLLNGEVFTGTGELNSLPDVLITGKTDQNGSISLQFSHDGTNWDSSIPYSYTANSSFVHKFIKGQRYFRLIFTNNSGSDQTFF